MGEVTRTQVGTNTLVVPDGPLHTAEHVDALRVAFEACLQERQINVLLDAGAVSLVNSGALEAILEFEEQLTRIGGSLSLANLAPLVDQVMRLTGLAQRLAVIREEEQAGYEEAPAPEKDTLRIGEILVTRGFAAEDRVEEALELQKRTGERMAQIMVEKGWISEPQLLECLGYQLGLPYVALQAGLYDPEVVCSLDREVSRRLCVAALFRIRDTIFLATPDPQSIPSMETVEDLTNCRVRPVLATADSIRAAIEESHGSGADLSEYLGDLKGDITLVETELHDDAVIDELAAGSPVINLINGLIQRAVRDKASDIHIEPMRRQCRIRFRVDGVLYTVMTPPIEVHPALVSRLKVMANLDIAERRLPQDGRIQVATAGRSIDLRFSSLPGIFGEKVVLRVLDKAQSVLEVERLGMHESNLARFRPLLERSHGLLLVTGPTGSGKTTTLYAALHTLNSDERNVVTIEDPVEYQVDGLSQNQIREQVGLDFARFLKHVLRQDPDVIMVGEIRERETAEIAVQAALTGHLVLSTLHTNDSPGAITRMLDMGIEPFLLASSLAGVVAQRLIRGVCPECRTSYVAPEGTLRVHGVEEESPLRLARGRGCGECYDSGYKGRLAIHEILEVENELERLIVSNPSREQLESHSASTGMRSLLQDGMERARGGETTIEEVLRMVST